MQNMYKICATRMEWREPQVQILLNSYEVFLRGGDSLLPVVPTHSLPHVSIRLSKNCRGEQLQVDGGEHAADEGRQRDVWSRIKTALAYGRADQLKLFQQVQHFHLVMNDSRLVAPTSYLMKTLERLALCHLRQVEHSRTPFSLLIRSALVLKMLIPG